MITRNRADEVLTTLRRLQALPEQPPIIVVDNGSSDGTSTKIRRVFPEVAVVRLEENRGAAGRNIGVASASTPYVAFADDDSWWRPGSLACAADLFDLNPRLGLVAGQVLVGEGGASDPICADMAASPLPRDEDCPGPNILGFVACGAVVRVDAFREALGFHPRFGVGGEEQLLAIDLARHNWHLCYVSQVVAIHTPSEKRNTGRRSIVLTRNHLWTAWLRRPMRDAVAATWRTVLAARHDPRVRVALAEAIPALPAMLSQRIPVEGNLREWLRMIE